jgi:uncharacterized protein YukE
MAITKANLQKMLNAIQNISDALPQMHSVDNQTEAAVGAVQAAWRSPTAAPKFYQHLHTWQEDHQTLNTTLDSLTRALSDARTDLLKKENQLTS